MGHPSLCLCPVGGRRPPALHSRARTGRLQGRQASSPDDQLGGRQGDARSRTPCAQSSASGRSSGCESPPGPFGGSRGSRIPATPEHHTPRQAPDSRGRRRQPRGGPPWAVHALAPLRSLRLGGPCLCRGQRQEANVAVPLPHALRQPGGPERPAAAPADQVAATRTALEDRGGDPRSADSRRGRAGARRAIDTEDAPVMTAPLRARREQPRLEQTAPPWPRCSTRPRSHPAQWSPSMNPITMTPAARHTPPHHTASRRRPCSPRPRRPPAASRRRAGGPSARDRDRRCRGGVARR